MATAAMTAAERVRTIDQIQVEIEAARAELGRLSGDLEAAQDRLDKSAAAHDQWKRNALAQRVELATIGLRNLEAELESTRRAGWADELSELEHEGRHDNPEVLEAEAELLKAWAAAELQMNAYLGLKESGRGKAVRREGLKRALNQGWSPIPVSFGLSSEAAATLRQTLERLQAMLNRAMSPY